jgi:hypothetical protein
MPSKLATWFPFLLSPSSRLTLASPKWRAIPEAEAAADGAVVAVAAVVVVASRTRTPHLLVQTGVGKQRDSSPALHWEPNNRLPAVRLDRLPPWEPDPYFIDFFYYSTDLALSLIDSSCMVYPSHHRRRRYSLPLFVY